MINTPWFMWMKRLPTRIDGVTEVSLPSLGEIPYRRIQSYLLTFCQPHSVRGLEFWSEKLNWKTWINVKYPQEKERRDGPFDVSLHGADCDDDVFLSAVGTQKNMNHSVCGSLGFPVTRQWTEPLRMSRNMCEMTCSSVWAWAGVWLDFSVCH